MNLCCVWVQSKSTRKWVVLRKYFSNGERTSPCDKQSDRRGWRGCATASGEAAFRSLHSTHKALQTILCLNKDITSFKEIIYWEVWVDHRQGSQRDFSHFAFINLEKESISGKGLCSQWKWKGWGCSLLTVVRAGSTVSLAASQRFLSHLDTAWPWSVLLFYNRARVMGREVT